MGDGCARSTARRPISPRIRSPAPSSVKRDVTAIASLRPVASEQSRDLSGRSCVARPMPLVVSRGQTSPLGISEAEKLGKVRVRFVVVRSLPKRCGEKRSVMSTTTKPKELILDIGSEKTGSTSIQAALTTSSKALLRSQRVHYSVRTPLFLHAAHFPFTGAFLEPRELDFAPPSFRLSIPDV
jgi:hypothetical protein